MSEFRFPPPGCPPTVGYHALFLADLHPGTSKQRTVWIPCEVVATLPDVITTVTPVVGPTQGTTYSMNPPDVMNVWEAEELYPDIPIWDGVL